GQPCDPLVTATLVRVPLFPHERDATWGICHDGADVLQMGQHLAVVAHVDRDAVLIVIRGHSRSSSSGITATQHHTTNRSSRAPAIEKIMLTTPELHGPAP